MATLAAAMCCSHAPTLLRMRECHDGGWLRLKQAYERLRAELARTAPEFVVVICNDHFDNFFLSAFPTFALGVAPGYRVADEGRGGYWNGAFRGHEEAGSVLARGLVERGFDLTVCYGDMELDHGFALPVSILGGAAFPPIVPLVVNCVYGPQPSLTRCWDLGVAIRRTLTASASPSTYAVLATGGLSHQLVGPNFGMIVETFDREFLDVVSGGRRDAIREWPMAKVLEGGESATEVANWVVCGGIVGTGVPGEVLAYEPLPDALTGMAVMRYQVG